jgi:hypothetical protein
VLGLLRMNWLMKKDQGAGEERREVYAGRKV